ncbi:hypothetical protein [Mucilaginibacter celer]|uniref:SprT-like domain-containing protein n=1 Tax=Mucilaginibacter celer TaxID=2305508 RepID=A0A494VXQ2_9SPHI|nr:hypothetical protein [Mucilaginibacter celer]AYL98891.1 hypothetical protein HYN43_028055 [Mucilaginibacter celer]
MKKPKPAFKNLILLCAPVALAAMIVGSCKKDNHSPGTPAAALAAVTEAKSWYENAYPANTKLATQDASEDQDWSQGVKPDWSNGAVYTRFDDDVVEMPVDATISGKLNIGLKEQTSGTEFKAANSKSSFLLIKTLGTYHAYIMTIIGDPLYLKGDLTKLDNNKYNKRDSDFTGVVLYSTPKGKFVSAWTYNSGKISGQISPDSASAGAVTTGKEHTNAIKTNLTETTTCYTWTQTSSYNGQTTGTVVLEHYCVTTYSGSLDSGSGGGGGGSIPVAGTGGGGGGGSTTTPPPPAPCVPTNALDNVDKIKVNSLTVNKLQPLPGDPETGFPPPTGKVPCTTVTDASVPITTTITNDLKGCNGDVVSKLISKDLTGDISDIIQKVFKSSDKINLHFVESSKTNGGPALSTITSVGSDRMNIEVRVNTSVLPGDASQDYKASIFIHEIIHSYYLYKGFNLNDQLKQHTDIAHNYIADIASMLTQAFGTDSANANALAFGGLKDFAVKYPTDYNKLLQDKGLTEQQRNSYTEWQRAGLSGKKCN